MSIGNHREASSTSDHAPPPPQTIPNSRRSAKRVSVIHDVIPSTKVVSPALRDNNNNNCSNDGGSFDAEDDDDGAITSPLSPQPDHTASRGGRSGSLQSLTSTPTEFQCLASDDSLELLSCCSSSATSQTLIPSPPRQYNNNSGGGGDDFQSFYVFGLGKPSDSRRKGRGSQNGGDGSGNKGGSSTQLQKASSTASYSSKPLPIGKHQLQQRPTNTRQMISHNGEDFEELPSYPSLPSDKFLHPTSGAGRPLPHQPHRLLVSAKSMIHVKRDTARTPSPARSDQQHTSGGKMPTSPERGVLLPSPSNAMRPTMSWSNGCAIAATTTKHQSSSSDTTPGGRGHVPSSPHINPSPRVLHSAGCGRISERPAMALPSPSSQSRQKQTVTLADIAKPSATTKQETVRYLPVQHRVDLNALRGKNKPQVAATVN
ncbi:Hypothetical protein, putative [Bodo saltans]|uniref:Uncharacterized protein n=1 Tax=Bodo saltans TaxID=75058 RepID=A0A0S4J7E7_BODSA|nr:Hypothetical protein, putative [Bodo saltans]|eukprot:CUG76100.1 Hypothetical protein, putative [Bodo saltans]